MCGGSLLEVVVGKRSNSLHCRTSSVEGTLENRTMREEIQSPQPQYLRQLRLFLEEICCEICRFRHVEQENVSPDHVQVAREVDLGRPGAFADIVVEPNGLSPYIVEVKYGYPSDRMVQHLTRKYGRDGGGLPRARRLVLVVDTARYPQWTSIESHLREAIHPDLILEIWDERRLIELIHECFGIQIAAVSVEALRELRFAIDDAKWRYAFGGEWPDSPLKSSLLWHFGFWRLMQLHRSWGLAPDQILPPGRYRAVVVLLADLSSFSSYVRDTHDEEVVRTALTTFYSNSRYAIMNAGGMMYQFVGDEVVALFGIPVRDDTYARRALDCAHALAHIGSSVSNKWQREIDRVQTRGGVHIGMAVGDVEVVSLRPFCRNYIGVIADSINMAARLTSSADSSEVVVSNTYFQMLPDTDQVRFTENEPVDARNVGLIKSWKLRVGSS
jgi:class 3 adenylate cyclase